MNSGINKQTQVPPKALSVWKYAVWISLGLSEGGTRFSVPSAGWRRIKQSAFIYLAKGGGGGGIINDHQLQLLSIRYFVLSTFLCKIKHRQQQTCRYIVCRVAMFVLGAIFRLKHQGRVSCGVSLTWINWGATAHAKRAILTTWRAFIQSIHNTVLYAAQIPQHVRPVCTNPEPVYRGH